MRLGFYETPAFKEHWREMGFVDEALGLYGQTDQNSSLDLENSFKKTNKTKQKN